MNFCILSESLKPNKKTKAELEQIVKVNGGKIFQSPTAANDIICVADKKVVKVASLIKSGATNIVRPVWILDAIKQHQVDVGKQKFVLPFEMKHMFFIIPEDEENLKKSVDKFGDSYARDVEAEELKGILEGMTILPESDFDAAHFLMDLHDHGHDIGESRGWMFQGVHIYVDLLSSTIPDVTLLNTSGHDLRMRVAGNLVRFAGGKFADNLSDESITHILVDPSSPRLSMLRKSISERKRLPRIVTIEWVEESWKERTLLDEERYAPLGR